MKKLLSLCIPLFLCAYISLEGCTGFKLKADNGAVVHGRTLEFGVKIDTSVVFVPRNISFKATTPMGTGLNYSSKYAAIGAIGYDNLAILDGINEKGLSIGTFYFPGYASYIPTTETNLHYSLSPVDFPHWILTQYSSLQEVKEGINNIALAPTVYPEWGTTPPPFHYIVYDKEGASIVIEPLPDGLIVRDNPLGVFSNSPTFDWHMTNLRNYINLTTVNSPSVTIDGVTLSSFGQGSGMVGLPGDFSPPSRFVRAAIFSYAAIPSKNSDKAVFQAFHILNQFDIPVGIAREHVAGRTFTDYTLMTTVHDPNRLYYYFRTFDDPTIRFVDLNAFDKNGQEVKKVTTEGATASYNISNTLINLQKSP